MLGFSFCDVKKLKRKTVSNCEIQDSDLPDFTLKTKRFLSCFHLETENLSSHLF